MDKRPSLHSRCRHELRWNVLNVPSFAQAAEPFHFPQEIGIDNCPWLTQSYSDTEPDHQTRRERGRNWPGSIKNCWTMLEDVTRLCCKSEMCPGPWMQNLPDSISTFHPVLTKFPQIFFREVLKGQYLSLRFLVFCQHSVLLVCSYTAPQPVLTEPLSSCGFTSLSHQLFNYKLHTNSPNNLSHWRVSASHWRSQSPWNPQLSNEKRENVVPFLCEAFFSF